VPVVPAAGAGAAVVGVAALPGSDSWSSRWAMTLGGMRDWFKHALGSEETAARSNYRTETQIGVL